MPPSDLIAVFVVRGQEFERMVDIARPRAEACLGIPIVVLRPEASENIWHFKLSLLERLKRPVLCLDSDLLFRSWDWSPFNWNDFCAVHDPHLETWKSGATVIQKYYQLDKGINGGLWYSPYCSDFVQMFRTARDILEKEMLRCRYALGDQTALNAALQRSKTPVTHLPLEFNWQVKSGAISAAAKVLHLSGDTLNTPEGTPQPLRKLRRFLEYHRQFPCLATQSGTSST